MNKMDIPIKGIEDLPKQTKIKYGAIKGSYTATFFKVHYQLIYDYIWLNIKITYGYDSTLSNCLEFELLNVQKNMGCNDKL